MSFADNWYLLAETKGQMLKMIGDATGNLQDRGFDWKEDQMEVISWSLDGNIGDLKIEEGGKEYMIKVVDSMSAMRLRMNKADKAMRMDIKFHKNKGIAEGRKHSRYKEVVQWSMPCTDGRAGSRIS